jgi:chromate transporter
MRPDLDTAAHDTPVPLGTIFTVFLRAGAVSFGGGVVAYLRNFLVQEAGWLDDERFLGVLEMSQTIPGLVAVNVSVIVGDTLRGVKGATVAVAGMLLPGAAMVVGLGIFWQEGAHNPSLRLFLLGVAAAAAGLLASVTWQLGRRHFAAPRDVVIAAATLAAVSLLHLPLLLVLAIFAPVSIWLHRPTSRSPKRADQDG